MNASQIAELVDEGIVLDGTISLALKRRGEINALLIAAGREGWHVPLADADRDGRQWLAHGTLGIVPVVFTSDLLLKSFAPKSKHHERITLAATIQEGEPSLIGHFYEPVKKLETKFKDGKKFRTHAAEMLGDKAPAFITACLQRDKFKLPKSSVKVLWNADDSAEEAHEE